MRLSRVVYALVKGLVRGILVVYCRLSVRGRERVPRAGGVLLAANHCSYLDPPAVAVSSPRRVNFVAREELFQVPVFRSLITVLGAHRVARGKVDRAIFRTVETLLNQGEAVLIFPEGTRSPDARLMALEPGVAFLARRTGAPIVPVGVVGTQRAMPYHSMLLRPAKVTVQFGAPIPVERGHASRESIEPVLEQLRAALCALLPEEMRPSASESEKELQ